MSRPKHSLSRREFLAAGAAAVAAPYVLTSSALGSPQEEPAGERIGLAFIGCGRRGLTWVLPASRLPQVQCLWLCDVDSRRLEYALKYLERRAKGCRTTKDFLEVLADPKVDAVVICTPDHWHAVMATEAARAGKDVFCESPLSLTVREARAMATVARRYGRIFQAGTYFRSFPAYIQACDLVRTQKIGQVRAVYVQAGPPSRPCFLGSEAVPEGFDWDMWLGPAPWAAYNSMRCAGSSGGYGWRAWRDYSGGAMTFTGGLYIDAVHWALGLDDTGPVEIVPPDGKDNKFLTFRYAKGLTVYNGKGEKGAVVDFVGSEGTLGLGVGPRGYQTWPEDIGAVAAAAARGRHYREGSDHLGNFLECVKTRRPPLSSVESACRSITVCHLGNIAVWLNRPLKWDPVKEEIVGDEEAARWLDRPRRGEWRV